MLSALNHGYRSFVKAFSQQSIDVVDASPTTSAIPLRQTRVANDPTFVYCRQCEQVTSAAPLSETNNNGDDQPAAATVTVMTKPSQSDSDDSIADTATITSCGTCANTAVVVLTQVRTNHTSVDCATCGTLSTPVIDFECVDDDDIVNGDIDDPCVMCLPCFVAYAHIQLEGRRFRFMSTYGYTLACPTPGCNGCIKDAHHMLLLGQTVYDDYKRIAAEACIISSKGVYCPRAQCGEPFVIDDGTMVEGDDRLVCSQCSHTFCRHCRMAAHDCVCDSNTRPMEKITTTRLSAVKIRSIARECPECRSPTEKSMGCSHITCTQCHHEWCWVCRKQWTSDCQEEHWFDEDV